jgi:hypothetical protein
MAEKKIRQVIDELEAAVQPIVDQAKVRKNQNPLLADTAATKTSRKKSKL